MRILLMSSIVIIGIASLAEASPVNIPTTLKRVADGDNIDYTRTTTTTTDADGDTVTTEFERRNVWNDEEGVPNAGFAIEGDWVNQHDLDVSNGEVEGEFYGAKVILPVYLLGQWDWYGGAGMTNDLEYSATIAGNNVKYKLDDDWYWQGGANYILYRNPDYYGLSLWTDANYRRNFETEYDEIDVNGTSTAFTAHEEPVWSEWQAALGASAHINHVMLYGGGKYSDVSIDADVTAGGTRYDLDEAESEENFGPFAGLSLLPNDNWSVDLEGRWVDEEAYTASVTYKY